MSCVWFPLISEKVVASPKKKKKSIKSFCFVGNGLIISRAFLREWVQSKLDLENDKEIKENAILNATTVYHCGSYDN